jgi:acyl homoserine lactone synthase
MRRSLQGSAAMIEIITPDIAFSHRDKIAAMHRQRHELFRERMGWDVNSRNGMERDVYDLLNPIYLLSTTQDGEVEGSWRLLPTTGPYMLRDIFPQLMDGEPIPVHPTIWETSRFAVNSLPDTMSGLRAVSRVTREMFCGLVELCLLFGIREIVTVYDIRIGRLLDRIGCAPFWRSHERKIGNTITVAGRFEISDDVLQCIRNAGGITEPVLFREQPLEYGHAA